MALPLNDVHDPVESEHNSGRARHVHGKKIMRPIHLLSLSKESEQPQSAAFQEDDLISRFADILATTLPSIASISEVPTQVEFHMVENSSPSLKLGFGNDFAIDEQATLIIPAIPHGVLTKCSDSPRGATKAGGSQDGAYVEGSAYAAHIRTLVKSSGIYALSSFASPLIGLVLAPFLTRNLSYADYGALAVLNTALALLAGLTQLGLNSAFFRSYNYDYESSGDRSAVLSMVVLLLLLVAIPTAVATAIAAPWLSTLLVNSTALADAVRLVGVVVLLQNLTVPGFAWLRAENRASFFSLLSIANLLVTLGASICFVGVMHMGIEGSLIATGTGYAFVVLCTLPLILLRAGIRLRVDIAWGLLAFGVPNVANFVSVWVLQLSDRYLLGRLGSLTQTASYSVAYSLGGIVSIMIIAPFSLAWPSIMYSIAKRDDAAQIFRVVFRWLSFLLLFAAFALSLISIAILFLFFPSAYHSAARIIPIIGMSIMFYGVYNFLTLGVSIRRKTWFAVIFTAISALINVGLNLFLIPLYGSIGAALSTLIAYALLALIAYVVNQRIYPVPFDTGLFLLALLIGVALYIGSSLIAGLQETVVAWICCIAMLIFYGGCLAVLGKLPGWSRTFKGRIWGKEGVAISRWFFGERNELPGFGKDSIS